MTNNQQSTTMKDRFEYNIAPEDTHDINGNIGYRLKDFINEEIALAVKQEQNRILKKARAILDEEMKVYGTDKHGLSYEQLEEIIKK